ncbi:hypothetical protein BDZ90DRAFT_278763 [Jaminaea rosea]|uniref:Conserved oligomeric Golgi complex subunit 7 n=1 Tax=Jaminaea rosea TaxID=1569628 RepID=A0A316UWU9_9BASI|nr:hypothetical protein BDZ90DRAFT_278763 [Jaminaea rosea]PWN28393.1 hypothetical protein BDZ90DRAFT_278763 [Jaminaea rosea]
MATSPTRTRPRAPVPPPVARSSSSSSSLLFNGNPPRHASSADIVEETEAIGSDDGTAGEDDLLASLDGDDFDPVIWLNDHLDDACPQGSAASASLPEIDAALSSLITSSSIARSDVGTSIGEAIARSSRDVPKLADDMTWVTKSVSTLQSKIDHLASMAPDYNQDPGSSALSHLAQLHHLHSQLASYQSLLRLASSWSTLASDVSSLLTEANSPSIPLADLVANLNSASMRLTEAKDSLNVFGDPKEAQEKAKLLLDLTDGFEATVRPKLVQRIRALPHQQSTSSAPPTATPEDIEAIRMLANLLERVGRGAVFGECWRRTRAEALLESWKRSSSAPAGVAPSSQVQSLLFSVVSLLSSERAYAPILFPENTLAAVTELVEGTLQCLSPSLGQFVETARASNEEGLLEVIKIVRVMREGGRDISRILTRLAVTSSAPTASFEAQSAATVTDGTVSPQAARQRKISDAPTSPTHDRRASLSRRRSSRLSSKRLSISGTGHDESIIEDGKAVAASPGDAASVSVLIAAERRFCEAYYTSLVSSWDSFGASERALLRALWQRESQTLVMYSRPTAGAEQTLSSVYEHLARSMAVLIDLSEDSLGRCLELTRGLAVKGLLSAVEDVVAAVVEEAGKDVEALCRGAWQKYTLASARFDGSEWNAFGEVARVLAGMRGLCRRAQALHASLVAGLKETSLAMAAKDASKAEGSAESQEAVIECLIKLRAATGPTPAAGEVALLMEKSTVTSDPGEREARKQIAAMPSNSEPSNTASLGPIASASTLAHQVLPSLPLLPRLTQSIAFLLTPFLHSLLLLPLSPLLSQLLTVYSDLPHWTSKTLPGQVSNEFQLDMPSFSLGPTELMQSVGEGLLGLVRELEGWMQADQDERENGIRWGVELMVERARPSDGNQASSAAQMEERSAQDAKAERRRSSMLPPPQPEVGPSLSPTKQRRQSSFLSASGGVGEASSPSEGLALSTSPSSVSPPLTRNSTSAAAALPEDAQASSGDAVADASAPPSLDPLRAYLSLLLTHLIEAHLLRSVLPRLPLPPSKSDMAPPGIPRMTQSGWRQLEADVDYLGNILSALDGNAAGGRALPGPGRARSGEQEDGTEQLDERLRGWKDTVGTRAGYKRTASSELAGDEIDDEVAYTSPWAGSEVLQTSSSTGPATVSSSSNGRGPTSNNLETASLRRMLFAQRNRKGGGADSPSSSSSRPGSRGGPESSSGYAKSVDLSAMNVGMGW